jgi:hypothetical protein
MKSFKQWFYEFKHGHPFLLSKEVDIICQTRSDEEYLWMTDLQIQRLIKNRITIMYKNKFPNAKPWRLCQKPRSL